MSVYSETLELIRRERLFQGAGTVVVGLSGGPDSVCLLDVLWLMTERGELDLALHAAHLNHCLRGAESDADEAFVRELTERLDLPLSVGRRDVAASREEAGGSLEETARRERYA
ncbi:MAG: ATP-binding protein, partial [Planctomycetota bacterium]